MTGRTLATLVAACLACAVGLASADEPAAARHELAPAPDFVLKSLDGRNIRLSEYRGRVVALSFWAGWCGECRAALESLEQASAAHAGAGLATLAVSLDADSRSAARALRGIDARFPILYDAGGEVGRLYDVESLPMTVLIDRDGVLRQTFNGKHHDMARLAAATRSLLAEY